MSAYATPYGSRDALQYLATVAYYNTVLSSAQVAAHYAAS